MTRFAVARYRNVLGSPGSIVPLFRRRIEIGEPLPITDDRMTCFWVSLQQAVASLAGSFESMNGGELFVPRIPNVRLVDLVDAVTPG